MARFAQRAVVVSMVTALLLGSAWATSKSAAADDRPALAFGALPQTRGNETQRQATEALEAQIGRKLEVVRVFERWDDAFPDSFHTWLRSGDRTIIMSIKPIRGNGSQISWSAVANASPGSQVDTEMRSWARRIRDFEVPIFVTFHHEPEQSANVSFGTATDYIAAWRRWVEVFRAEGATNAHFMWIMTAHAHALPSSDRRYAPKWYPGDAWVDAIAADAYNWGSCRTATAPWRTLESVIEPFRQFGTLHPTKPLWLAEWASWEDPSVPGRKARWIDEARELFSRPTHAQFAGVSYFNSQHTGNGNFPDCEWWVDTSASSLASFVAMGADPLYQGDPFGGPTDPVGPVFRAVAEANGSVTAASITVPAQVQAGDRLLYIVTAATATTLATPSGWTLLGTDSDGNPDMRSWVFTRVADGATAGSMVSAALGTRAKVSRMLLAYAGAGTPAPIASAVAGPSTNAHATPAVTAPGAALVISYWSDKSNDNTTWSTPAPVVQRALSTTSGSGRITAVVGDSGPLAAGTWPGATAISGSTSAKAIMWSIVVPPS